MVCLTLVYAYILSWGSNMISDGSELLLLIPSWRDLVGSIVLPILGAVPDGAIVLFSGLGPDAAQQVTVGVGALAGSTIMLLTVPWFLCILAGRVDMDRDTPIYSKRGKLKLTPHQGVSRSLFHTGVTLQRSSHVGGKVMLATALIYLIIQGPAFEQIRDDHDGTASRASYEQTWCLVGVALCIVAFIAYIIYQVKYPEFEERAELIKQKAIDEALISMSGAFAEELISELEESNSTSEEEEGGNAGDRTGASALALIPIGSRKVRDFLRRKFNKYDVDKNGTMDKDELRMLIKDLNEDIPPDQFQTLMAKMDKDGNNAIDFEEFTETMIEYILRESKTPQAATRRKTLATESLLHGRDVINDSSDADGQPQPPVGEDEDDDDDEEEIPEVFKKISSPSEQQRAIKWRALWMMGLGTAVVLLFSDPMVDMLSSIGSRIGVPAFYVAFVLSPLASNASELIAAYNYASKKTKKTVNIAFATLEGAATMNNTFCLLIFLLIVYVKKLEWTFSAETISILLIQIMMAIMAQKSVHRLVDAVVIISLYPASLLVVALIESFTSLD